MPFPHVFASLPGGQYPASTLDDNFSFSGDVATDTGSVNAYVCTVALQSLLPGQRVVLQSVVASNTGASTLNVNGSGALPIQNAGGTPLSAGELPAGSTAILILNAAKTVWFLLNTTGGTFTSGVIGSSRNLAINITAASATATVTADEVIVGTSFGGLRYCLPNFNASINLGTTGAGGMDTGSAPVSGFVALYAIYSPVTGVSAILATNATSAKAPEIYGGTNMPAGFTASALVSVWPTNASGQLIIGTQQERRITFETTQAWESNLTVTNSQISLAGVVPLNAKRVSGYLQAATSASTAQLVSLQINADASLLGAQYTYLSSNGASASLGNFQISLKTPQIAYVTSGYTGPGATLTYIVSLSSYEI